MTYKEIAVNFDSPTEKILCEKPDKHSFVWFSDEAEPDTCLCGHVKITSVEDDRITRVRHHKTFYGRFHLPQLTKNQDEPYFVREWDIDE